MTQTVIHIDANNQVIRMVRIPSGKNLADLQRLVGGSISMACRLEHEHVLFVDDEGLFKPQRWFFRLRGMDTPFAGNGVIVGPERYDHDGEYLGTDNVYAGFLTAARRVIEFLPRAYVDAWAKANASEPEMAIQNLDTGETEIIAYRGNVWGDMPRPEDE